MPSLRRRPDPVPAQLGRVAQDLGLAALLGGNLFGRLAFHPSVAGISDPRERGKVVNAAWRRYGTVNSLGLAALTAGWASSRQGDERPLARVKDVLVGTVAVTGLATAVEGVRFSRQAPGGAVALEDGDTAAPEAGGTARRNKRSLTVLGTVNALSEVGLVAVSAALRD